MSTSFPFPETDMKLGAPDNSGTPGPQGEPGKSAYDLAVEGGFDGTLTEWLTSLKGEPGAAGAPGEPGADGTTPVDALIGKLLLADEPSDDYPDGYIILRPAPQA